ncbi:MAG: putative Pectine lyase family protein [Gemmatimonadetes bacterium]|nr:putative Pectine lyase family protein [Gemmatimonadota bacterium]
MKGDFSRQTFDPTRHFSGVRMQQGRVQLDADWNEQADIGRWRDETGALDTLGGCGGPLHFAAFGIVARAALPADEAAWVTGAYPGWADGGGDLLLSRGRYYVDGILVENEHAVPFTRQPDLPAVGGTSYLPGIDPAIVGARPLADGTHLLYLDVWQRHLTALEDPRLREVALGGPDTATRTRTVWQVRSVPVPAATTCQVDPPAAYADATADTTGRMRARAPREQQSDDPCVLPAGAGYRGLENQLYRVEIHGGGPAYVLGVGTTWKVTDSSPSARTLQLSGSLASLAHGAAVEVYTAGTGADPQKGFLAFVDAVDGGKLTLNAVFPALDPAVETRVRAVAATCKWSRDNGTVVTRVQGIKDAEVVVESLGPDDVLGFGEGDWVELTDDRRELLGLPGELLQVKEPQPATRTLVMRTAPATLGATDGVDPARNPRLRRWDGIGAVKAKAPDDAYAALEDGVQVRFEEGTYATGEHWLIPARTATSQATSGGIEWPVDDPDAAHPVPLALRPAGIRHHYCRLGVVTVAGGNAVLPYADCRCLFAPLTEVNALAYVSGAGQEAMPDLTAPGEKVQLGLPLVAGIANGHCQEDAALVRFRTLPGSGPPAAARGDVSADGTTWGASVDVPLAADGTASCLWRLAGDGAEDQLVEARLLQDGVPVQLPIRFNASLSVASLVAYDPGACAGMAGRKTVQSAIDRLAAFARIHPVGGDAQEVMPGEPLDRTIKVLVASDCGPLPGVKVTFAPGTGTVAPASPTTGADGTAETTWKLDGATHYQELTASIAATPAMPVAAPSSVTFSATLSTADRVRYDPGKCGPMAGQDTVQKALDRIVGMVAIYPAGETERTVLPGETWDGPAVRVASDCGPLASKDPVVVFEADGGTFENGAKKIEAGTDADGVARVRWTPDPSPAHQSVRATLRAPEGRTEKAPGEVVFGVWVAAAENVAYTPSEGCGDLVSAGVSTVKEAIDFLCSHTGVCCEVTLAPGDDVLEKIGRYLGTDLDLDICFRPGRYEIAEPVVFKQKRNVRITGRDGASHVACAGSESVFVFHECDRVTVREISLESGTAGSAAPNTRLNGVLSFRDCAEVTVDSAVLRCAPGARRAATCITASSLETKDFTPPLMRVDVRNTEAWVGHRQVGILLVNPDRAVVENNVLRHWGKNPSPRVMQILEEPDYRSWMREYVWSLQKDDRERLPRLKDIRLNALAEARRVTEEGLAPVGSATLTAPAVPAAGKQRRTAAKPAIPVPDEAKAAPAAEAAAQDFRFVAGPVEGAQGGQAWRPPLTQYAGTAQLGWPPELFSPQALAKLLALLGDERTNPEQLSAYARVFEAVGFQGIVVAGRSVRDVRIAGNSVQNFMQCIHVGVSHAGRDTTADSAGGVTITDNTVAVKLPWGIRGERHGIFVGNAVSVRVAGNRVMGTQAGAYSNAEIDGVRVWGFWGPLVVVEQNHVMGCRTGVVMRALNHPDPRFFRPVLWRASWNMAQGGSVALDTGGDPRIVDDGNLAS